MRCPRRWSCTCFRSSPSKTSATCAPCPRYDRVSALHRRNDPSNFTAMCTVVEQASTRYWHLAAIVPAPLSPFIHKQSVHQAEVKANLDSPLIVGNSIDFDILDCND